MSPASSGECMPVTGVKANDRLPCGLQKWSTVGILGFGQSRLEMHIRAEWEHESKHAQ